MTYDSIIIAPEDWPDAYMEVKQKLDEDCKKWEQKALEKLCKKNSHPSQSNAQRAIEFT